MYMEYSFRGLLNALFRHKWKIFLIATITILLGLSYILNIEKNYESNAALLVKFGQGAMPDLDREIQQDFSQSDRKELMQSYVKMMRSRDLLIGVIEKITAEQLYPPKKIDREKKIDPSEELIKESPVILAVNKLLGGDLSVIADRKSNIIDLRVRNKDPLVAAEFTKMLMKAFILHQNEIYSTSDAGFLEQQIKDSEAALAAVQKDFTTFKQANGVSNLERESDLLLSEKSNITSLAFTAISRAQEELADSKSREAEMLVTYQADSPILKSLQDRISIMEEVISDRQYDLMATADDTTGTVAPKLAKIDARISYLEKHRPEYEQFIQKIAEKDTDYKYYKQKGEDARINEILRQQNITRISVIESPIVASKPVSTKKKLMLIAFIMLGGILGLGVALIFELLDDTIKDVQEAVSSTEMPVLVSFDRKERAR